MNAVAQLLSSAHVHCPICPAPCSHDTGQARPRSQPSADQMHHFALNHRLNRTAGPKYSYTPLPVSQPEFLPGDRVLFHGDRGWWTVQAHNDTHTVLTRPGRLRHGYVCTVISWADDRRGPQNTSRDVHNTQRGAQDLADAFGAGQLQLDHSHAVYLDIAQVRSVDPFSMSWPALVR